MVFKRRNTILDENGKSYDRFLCVIFDWNYGILDGSKGNKSIFFCSDTSY